jgi:hypothetical protein
MPRGRKAVLVRELAADLEGRGAAWLLSALSTPAGRAELADAAAWHGLKMTELSIRVTIETRVARAGDFPAALRAAAGDGVLEVR